MSPFFQSKQTEEAAHWCCAIHLRGFSIVEENTFMTQGEKSYASRGLFTAPLINLIREAWRSQKNTLGSLQQLATFQ